MEMKELKRRLEQFYGSENYYKDFMGVLLTDGVKALEGLAKCGWLISDIAVIVKIEIPKEEEFVVINISVKDSKAKIVYSDGNDKVLFSQDYKYTDFPEGDFKLYYTNNVIMLPSEY